MDTENALIIWRWRDAPEEYRRLSGHGGDEDWVLFAPNAVSREGCWPYQIMDTLYENYNNYSDIFGHVDRHVFENGDVVVIFAHA